MEMVWIHIIFMREKKILTRFAGEGCGVKRPQDANSLETQSVPTR